MKDSTTQQLLTMLQQLQELHPEWRFGQLVANVPLLARGTTESAVWDVEDSELLKAAEEHLKFNSASLTRGETPKSIAS